MNKLKRKMKKAGLEFSPLENTDGIRSGQYIVWEDLARETYRIRKMTTYDGIIGGLSVDRVIEILKKGKSE